MEIVKKSNDYQLDYLQTISGFENPNSRESQQIEISGYNVIYDQDLDILNQGSISHIKNYFDNKDQKTNNHLIKQISIYSINNRFFVIKLCIVIVLLFIIHDFVISK